MDTAANLIKRARTKLILNQPFWGTLALYLALEQNEEVPTLATDGNKIYYNSEYVCRICKDDKTNELEGVLVHEISHVAFQHIQRQHNRIFKIWNMATDYTINYIIKSGNMQLPEGILYDSDYANKTAEEVYDILMKKSNIKSIADLANEGIGQMPGGGKGNNSGQGKVLDDHSKWQDVAKDKNKSEEMSREWKVRIAQASEVAKGRGCLPAGMGRTIDEILEPRLDWKEIVAPYVRPSRGDYTFSTPDSRFMSDEYDYVYLPSFFNEEVEDIVIAVDTSGSISHDELKSFLSHIHYLLKAYPQLRGQITSCDTHPANFIEVTNDTDIMTIPLQGGGGTDFVPVFDLIKKTNIDPALLIYFTDGDGNYPKEKPEYPVLWVMTDKRWEDKIPFGRFILHTPDREAA